MIRLLRAATAIAVVSAVVVGVAPSVHAHEFGPFAIDRYAGILVSPDAIELDYVLDLAETPTQSDGDRIEADPAAYCAELAEQMTMTIDSAPVALEPSGVTLLRQDGDGGLTTLRVECGWTASIEESDAERTLFYDDANYRERVGWREIVVVGDRTEIIGDVTDDSVTERATDFPDADDNPDVSSVEFGFAASDAVGPAELDKTVPGDDDNSGDAFSNLIADADGGIWAMVAALGLAAFLGALHSLAPGHGKTVIGAYLVGTRGTKVQAFVLAVAVALSHTLGVLVLGIITYVAGARFAPERVYPWLQGISAVIVLAIGIWLVVTALREWRARRAGREIPHHQRLHAHGDPHLDDHDDPVDLDHIHGLPAHSTARVAAVTVATGTAVVAEPELRHAHTHAAAGHSHDVEHGHSHADDHVHDHDHPHDHDHDHDHPHDHDHDHPHVHDHTHDHDHDHDHAHGMGHSHEHANGHGHDHDHSHDHDHLHDHDHSHDHDHDHTHDHDHPHDHDHGDGWHRHGIFPHTHRYDLDELDLAGKVSWKTLAVLGLSGGLVPSTSAIIVLLGAIQLNRIAFGGLLIFTFGLGMAIALISVGLGMVALRDRAFGAMEGNQIIDTARRVIVPVAAAAVMCIGIFLVVRAYLEIVDL